MSSDKSAELLNLKVVGQDGQVVQFKIKATTPLRKLMHAFCDRQRIVQVRPNSLNLFRIHTPRFDQPWFNFFASRGAPRTTVLRPQLCLLQGNPCPPPALLGL